jgi:hypothetical protein
MAGTVGSAVAASTMNIDVHSIVRRYNRMLVEIAKSQSSGISQVMPFDVTRIRANLSAMRAQLDFVVAQPLLDCPETGPMEMPLPPMPAVTPIENESAYDLMTLLEVARDEIANSQSSRIPSNLVKFDYDRQVAYLTKANNLLAYVEGNEPLDLPESSPMIAMSGAGQRGI